MAPKVPAALEQGGFSDIKLAVALWQLQARYGRLTVWGSIDIRFCQQVKSKRK
jgi:hypothetical protein